MQKTIDAVCTMATKECVSELALLHRSLRTFHPELPLFIGCTRDAAATPAAADLQKDPLVQWVPCLDQYGPTIHRREMERQAGTWYASRHTDFMMEKSHLLELALATVGPTPTVAFLDCDITLLGELPYVPASAVVALSEHRIRDGDEKLFGCFNGGYIVVSDAQVLTEWRKATRTSRFFDQASLEEVASKYDPQGQLYRLPSQHNYGFWRLTQTRSPSVLQEAQRFSIVTRTAPSTKEPPALHLCYDSEPLCSIHTHFLTNSAPPRDVRLFNSLMRKWLAECSSPSAGTKRNKRYVAALEPLNNRQHTT